MKTSKITLIALLFASLCSCNFYKPTLINAPVLEEKGQLEVGVSIGSSADAIVSYAITDNIAIMGSAGTSGTLEVEINTTPPGSTEKYTFENNKYEGAVGYYKNTDDSFFFNVFAGYAAGKAGTIGNNFSLIESGYGANYQGFFSQASIHTKVGSQSYFGLLLRGNHFDFDDFNYAFDPTIDGRYLVKDPNSLIGQVALDFTIKGEKLGGFWQIQYAFHDNDELYMTLRELGIHFGVYLRLGDLFR